MTTQVELNTSEVAASELSTRTIDELRDHINGIHKQFETQAAATVTAFNASIESAYECGLALIEARRQVEHGQWLPWLQANCSGIRPRQCQSYIKIAENWPRIQALSESSRTGIVSINSVLRSLRDGSRQIRTAALLDESTSEPMPNDDSVIPPAASGSSDNLDSCDKSSNTPETGMITNVKSSTAEATKSADAPNVSGKEILTEKVRKLTVETLPEIVNLAKAFNTNLDKSAKPNVDVTRVLGIQEELTRIFQKAINDVSNVKTEVAICE